MAGGLVRARVQVEGDHQSTAVIGGVDVLAAISPGDVLVEEHGGDIAVEGNTVGLNAETLNGGNADLVRSLAVHRGESSQELRRGGLDSASQTSKRGEAVAGKSSVELVNSQDGGTGNTKSIGEVEAETSEAAEGISVLISGDGARGNRVSKAVTVLQRAEINGLSLSLGIDIPAVTQFAVCESNILYGAKTNIDGLNGPLKLVEQQVVGLLVNTDGLATVNTDQAEADTLDEDVVDLRVNEDVVNVELASLDVRDGHGVSAGAVKSGIEGVNVLENISSAGEGKIDEALTVGDRDGGDSKTRITVEPEEEGNPELDLRLNGLRSLRAVNEVLNLANTGTTTMAARGGIAVNLRETLPGDLLGNVTVPTNSLVGGNEELLVEVLDIRVVLIKRVTVNRHTHALNKALAKIINIGKQLLTTSGVSSRVNIVISIKSSDATKDNVEDHVVEEITKLRNRELHLRAQTSRARLDSYLVIFVTDSSEGLKVGIHEALIPISL